jgi:DNA-directed RNA polymerase specialized sigma24 family protein
LAIARNLVHDHRRRVQVRQFVALGTLGDLVEDGPSPEERLLRKEEVGRLLDALDGLGEDDREIVSLRYGSGLGGREVAEMLGISEANVRARLWCALRSSRSHHHPALLPRLRRGRPGRRRTARRRGCARPGNDGTLYEETPGRARSGWLLR